MSKDFSTSFSNTWNWRISVAEFKGRKSFNVFLL